MRVSHFKFVDDANLFLSEQLQGFKNVLTVLKVFEVISGMAVNLSKCSLAGINIDRELLDYSLNRCVTEDLLFTYLGVPLSDNTRCVSFSNLVVIERLNYWIGGNCVAFVRNRITLIQAYFSSITLYYGFCLAS